MEEKFNEVAKAYILYREKRRFIREEKEKIAIIEKMTSEGKERKKMDTKYLASSTFTAFSVNLRSSFTPSLSFTYASSP